MPLMELDCIVVWLHKYHLAWIEEFIAKNSFQIFLYNQLINDQLITHFRFFFSVELYVYVAYVVLAL